MKTLHRTNFRSPIEYSNSYDSDQVGVDATPSLTADDLRYLAAELVDLPSSCSALEDFWDEASSLSRKRVA